MEATERLRQLLDERGVKHYDGVECTYWGDTVLARRDGSCPIYRFSATEVADGVSVHLLRVSPEQAIEATLGRGTCHAERKVVRIPSEIDGSMRGSILFLCSECGMWLGKVANYCPNCGRKVVDE